METGACIAMYDMRRLTVKPINMHSANDDGDKMMKGASDSDEMLISYMKIARRDVTAVKDGAR